MANIRAEKDPITLIKAFSIVTRKFPGAHLLLVGAAGDQQYARAVYDLVTELDLFKNISFLGPRDDVDALLKACDIAVMSSATEGLPMALLEYGLAGLPTVATRVGQCAQVLGNGKAGVLVDPRSPEALAQALEGLLDSPERSRALGASFRAHVASHYSAKAVLSELCKIYDEVVSPRGLPVKPLRRKKQGRQSQQGSADSRARISSILKLPESVPKVSEPQ